MLLATSSFQKGDSTVNAFASALHTGVTVIPAGYVAVPSVLSGDDTAAITGVDGIGVGSPATGYQLTVTNPATKHTVIYNSATGKTTTGTAQAQAGGSPTGTATGSNASADILFGQGVLSSTPNILAYGLVTCSSGYSPDSLTPQFSTDGGSSWSDFAGVNSSSTGGGNYVASGYFHADGSDPADGTIKLQLKATCKSGTDSVSSTIPMDSVTLDSSNFATDATFTGSRDADSVSIHADQMPTCQSGYSLNTNWVLNADLTTSDGAGQGGGEQFAGDGSIDVSFADIDAVLGSDATTTFQDFGMQGDNRCTATVNSATTRSVSYVSSQTVNDIVGG
jgi:hypothetical protein